MSGETGHTNLSYTKRQASRLHRLAPFTHGCHHLFLSFRKLNCLSTFKEDTASLGFNGQIDLCNYRLRLTPQKVTVIVRYLSRLTAIWQADPPHPREIRPPSRLQPISQCACNRRLPNYPLSDQKASLVFPCFFNSTADCPANAGATISCISQFMMLAIFVSTLTHSTVEWYCLRCCVWRPLFVSK